LTWQPTLLFMGKSMIQKNNLVALRTPFPSS
jgi:hypothetical protein